MLTDKEASGDERLASESILAGSQQEGGGGGGGGIIELPRRNKDKGCQSVSETKGRDLYREEEVKGKEASCKRYLGCLSRGKKRRKSLSRVVIPSDEPERERWKSGQKRTQYQKSQDKN